MKYCPMKFMNADKIADMIFISSEDFAFNTILRCNEENCAWYCTYPNGEGECAIHSLPGLFDGLQDIAKEIGIK